jgi:cytoskeletal protein CcmA (bactofilin family)
MSQQPALEIGTNGAAGTNGGAGIAPGRPLVVGEGLRINGSLSCEGQIRIDGAVEGDISARAIVVGPRGNVLGTLTADDVVVLGTVTGIVYACSVTLGPAAAMEGDLVHETLCIEAGAIFTGACRRPAAVPSKPLPRRPALLMAPTIEVAPETAPAKKEPASVK